MKRFMKENVEHKLATISHTLSNFFESVNKLSLRIRAKSDRRQKGQLTHITAPVVYLELPNALR